jgi:hypothetical protein
MNNFIEKNAKKIIFGLVVALLSMATTLLSSCHNNLKNIDNNSYGIKVTNFVNLLNDPAQNAHGVLIIAPDRHDKLVILNKELNETKPCFWDPEIIIPVNGNEPILLPQECLRDNIKVLYNQQQIVTFTPAIKKTEYGEETLMYIADLDHRVVCTKPNGVCP